MMKRRISERVLVLIVSIAVLLSSTGVYSAFAQTYSESVSSTSSTTVSSSSSTAASTVKNEQAAAKPEEKTSAPNIVEGGGTVKTDKIEGSGTTSDPYCISNADELFRMQDIINNSRLKNKYFVLTNDIDLSSVSYSQLKANSVLPGTIVSVDKAKSDAVPGNVRFTLNGLNHKIYGLDINNAGSAGVAVFGYVSAKSVIKHIAFEDITINTTYKNAVSTGAIALYNNGEIRDCTANNVKLNVTANASGNAESKRISRALTLTESTGLVAVNNGKISNITVKNAVISAQADKKNIGVISGINTGSISSVKVSAPVIKTSACDAIGAVAGKNSGKIESVTAENIKANVGSKAAFGGIAGKNSGVITSCVTSGSAYGSAYTAGIVGTASSQDGKVTSNVKNCYSFVRAEATSGTGAIIATGESKYSDNVWSSETSGRTKAYQTETKDGDLVRNVRFVVVKEGYTAVIGKASLGGKLAGLTYIPDETKAFSFEGNGISFSESNESIRIKANSANKIGKITFTARIAIQSGCGNESVVSKNFTVIVLTVPETAKGDGLTEATALEISSSAALRMIPAVPFAHYTITKNVTLPDNWDSSFTLEGSVNGNGHKIKASGVFCSAVYGKITNLNVELCGKISTAMFGKAVNAEFDNVKLTKGSAEDGKSVYLSARKNNLGTFLNSVSGATKLNNCFTNIPVYISKNAKNVAGFIGVLDSDNAVITSCGAVSTITSENNEKAVSCAAFIGNAGANANGKIRDCYATLYSTVTNYVLAGAGSKSVKIENSYYGSSNKKAVAAPKDFTNVKASKWMFKSGDHAFVTGNNSSVSIKLPSNIISTSAAKASDFTVMYDASTLKVNTKAITVKNGVVTVPVSAAVKNKTISNSALVIVHKETGLRAELSISNGLEKDKQGNYILSSGSDLAYIGESLKTLKNKSFVISKDIDMTDVDFKVIGDAANAFTGKIDGKGHTVSGLKVSSKADAALFGILDGATVKNIKFKGANVKSGGSYAGVLAAQITGDSKISSVEFENCTVSGKENYAGVLAGSVKDSSVSDVEIKNCNVSALNNAGVFAGSVKSSSVSGVKASDVKAAGDNNIGLIGKAEKAEIKSVSVKDAQLSAKKNVGGVVGKAENTKLSKAVVADSKIAAESDALGAAPAAGGIVGEFSGKLSGAKVEASEIKADGNAAVAGGISAVSENSQIASSSADDEVSVKASVVGGIVGEAKEKTDIKNSKSCAEVIGAETATKVIEGAGGIIGRVSAEDFGSVTMENVNSAGSVKAADYVGGLIGSVISEKASGKSINDCVSAAEVESAVFEEDSAEGHIIGAVSELEAKDIEKSVSGVVFSSYASDADAYGNIKADKTYSDLNSAVKSSLSEVITDGDEVIVKVSNKAAEKLGFEFNEEDGWQSESDKRIAVVDSTENEVKLQAAKTGIVGIVGTYELADDEDITLQVDFEAESKIDTVLNGEGTKESPYIISNPSELEGISSYADKNAYFEITADINFAAEEFEFGGEFYNEGKGFTPVGTSDKPFSGVVIGNDHTITGLKVSDVECGALFAFTSGAEINGITLKNANISAENIAAGIVANAADTKITDTKVIDSEITAESEQGNAAAIAAYAKDSVINVADVANVKVASCKTESSYDVACAGAVCARAVDTVINGANVDEATTVESVGSAAGIAGYCDNVKITDSSVFAQVSGSSAAAVAAEVKGLLNADGIVAGGSVTASDFAAGIAAKAYDIIKANDVVISAEITGENETAILAAYADEDVYTDSEECEAEFTGIVYSSWQNSASPFASEKINAYQNAEYLDKLIDVNSLTVKDGEFLFAGKDEVKVSDNIESAHDLSGFSCVDVYSEPENLISYNKDNDTITALGTLTEGAKLVMKYDNGLEAAVDLVCVEGAEGEGTNASPYIINSEDTLKLLGIYPDAVFRMEKDVALTEEWTPVENFSGTLDGAGCEISSLNVNAENAGLFASLIGNAVVKNITFTDASVEGKSSAGVVAASVADNANISGINVISSTVKADDYAAAVAGTVSATGARISSCKVTGCTVSANDAAGIAALVSGKADLVSDSVDATEIKGSEAAGGIVAVASADSLKINSCESAADVSADNAGAIVGITEKAVEIISCVANGTVNGKTTEGGIIGFADGLVKITGSKALAKLSGKAENIAALVAKFANRPEDSKDFAANFSKNTVSGDYDEFEPAIMQYQNFVPADKTDKEITLEGSGTKADPYIIASAADLALIPDSSTAYYSLKSDIVITQKDYGISIGKDGETVYGVFSDGYRPIKNFAGVFDGNGHVIKGLYIDSVSDYVGLFANITADGTVKNLHIELLEKTNDADFCGIRGNDFVGGIAGYCDSVNGIENCSVVGSVISGNHAVGGLVGGLASSKIVNSFAMSEISAQNKAGGLAGITTGKSSIINSFAACDVNAAGGTIVGTNSGALTLKDVMVNGKSHGTDAVAVASNSGTIKAERALIAGGNEDNKTSVLNADEADYVYVDITSLGITDENITALTTSQLTSSKPEGLENWAQSQGKYPVPVMADSYSNKMAAKAAAPSGEEKYEETVGNLKVNYKLVNKSGDKAMDSALAGVLIKSKVNGETITSDFFTSSGKTRAINKLLVTTGGFYVDSNLPRGYEFKITAKDSLGREINISDAGTLGSYIECGSVSEVNLVISIVKTDIPWGLFSLWESLAR